MAQEAVTDISPRSRNPRGEGGRLRLELLDAAAELMAQHGSVDKVSVRAVAASAGVSPTAVYRHFADHSDLLWSAVQYCFDEFGARMLAASTSTDDVYERLVASGRAYVAFAMEETGKYRVMFSNRVQLPEIAATIEEPVGMTTFDHLVATVSAILTDRADERDARFVSVEVWTWIHGIVDLLGNHRELDIWPPVEDLLDDMLVRLDLMPR